MGQLGAGQVSAPLTDLLTRLVGTGETTRDTGDAQRGLRLASETRRNVGDGGDVRRMAHNPEVEGSNPSPATKLAGQGPLPILEEGFCMRPVNGFVNAALAQVARQSHPRLASGRPMSYSTL